MENDKIKNIKEHILKEAENVVEDYISRSDINYEFDDELEQENEFLKKKVKKQRLISIFLFILLIVVIILK